MDALIEDARISWSGYRDPTSRGCNRTALESLQQATTEVRQQFFDTLARIREHLRTSECIRVHWWYAPLIYVEVVDSRWKHYPCNMRMLLSFDMTDGKFASQQSTNCHAFARRGWRTFANEVAGYELPAYGDCGDSESTERC
jgi:hypothetical protein